MEARDDVPVPTRRPRIRARLLEACAILALAALLLAVGARALHGRSELVRVGDDQVAVVLDRWSGTSRATSVPGFLVRVPWVQEVTLLPRGAGSLAVGTPGAVDVEDPAAAAKLAVRASDGSSFRLENVVVQHAIAPDAATTVIEDLGPGFDPPRGLVAAHARAILRDELGRAPPEALARGEAVGEALVAATARLREALAPHGIAVLSIAAGEPEFDEAYEDTIGRAKTFRQQADELAESTERVLRERPADEASIAKTKELELAKLEGELVQGRGQAVRDERLARQEADDFFRAQARAGEAARLEKAGQAALVQARHVAAARDVMRNGADLEAAGDLPVRKALVEKLAGIRIDLVPRPREDGERGTRTAAASGERK